MKKSFKEILKQLDWSDGFRIPIANDENKQLEKEIEAKVKKKAELVEKLGIGKNRINAIDQHVKNINVERDYNQKLLSAYISQHNAEENFHKISENEIAALTQDIRDIEKEKKATQERIKLMEADISKLKNKLNSSEAVVALDKSKCLQWEETLNCKEDRQQLIEKYMKMDGKKFKELDLKRQKLVEDLQSHKDAIINITEEITEREVTIDKTAKLYTQLLENRRNLIDRWTHSIAILRQRDNSIQAIFKEIESLKAAGLEKLNILNESVEVLDNQSKNNKMMNYYISRAEKRLSVLRDERLEVTNNYNILDLENKIRQRSLNELNYQTEVLQGEIKVLKESNARKRSYINDCNNQIYDLKKTLDKIKDDEITVEDRTKQLKLMLENEEKQKLTILKETKKFQNLIHRTNTQVNELKNERKTIELRHQGALRQMELYSIHQSKEEKLLKEKQNTMDQLDLQIRNYEMQVSSYCEETDTTELERKKQIIKELEDILNDKKEIAKLLQSQIHNLESEIKKVQITLAKENQELEVLKNKHQNLSLLTDGSEKALKNSMKMNEERQVAENILELRVTQVEELMRTTGNKVYNLEQCHLHIHAAMKERMAEIKILREGLNAKYKLALNECSHLRAIIAEKKSQTLNYQTRYDTIMAASQMNGIDCNVSPPTTIQLKIQNARNKLLLQERGDELDMTIRKTEQEIKSMENTLRVVTACNENYKMSLVTDDDSDENLKQKVQEQLYEELCNVREDMKQKRMQYERMEKTLLSTQENQKMMKEDLQRLQEDKEKKHRDVTMLEKQITDQKGRISRADMRLKKLYKDIQRLCECGNNAETILLQEKDIVTRELEEINLLGLQRIAEFTIRHVEVEAYVKKLLAVKNIILPGIHHMKSNLSLGISDDSVASSVSSFSSRSKGKSSTTKIYKK
ncbi:hypothetical protein PV328_005947 [Microctonus aethiopoides]|uniref:Coiled-coil domain-containing protein 39 n=1 Tax=Microctonus aethiopoides TaxID=144406 RepID=A0AA39FN32_9HYME|nr:hypothetical protein PV328_005947 [Microctonus aethiopoides]